jgi:predicted dehydrogenase
MNLKTVSRRRLIGTALGTLAVAGLPAWYAKEYLSKARRYETGARKAFGPNDQIEMGLIGAGDRGMRVLEWALAWPGVEVTAVCDLDADRRAKAAKLVGPDCTTFNDFREMLGRKKLDAVIVATVDHWHVLAAVAAMKVGCDVYCEKPVGLTIADGRAMVKAARTYGRVVQVGTQQRSDPVYQFARDIIRAGRIGTVHTIEARIGSNLVGGPFPVTEAPAGFDWDFWQGPTPDVPFVKERCHNKFRWWYEYAGGKVTDWGAHHNDIAQWVLNADDTGPIAVTAVGADPSKEPNCYNCHPTFKINSTYANGTHLITTSDGENGNRFIGDEGWIFVNRERIEASDLKLLDQPQVKDAIRNDSTINHIIDFLRCVRLRERPVCDAMVGHRSATVCHLGTIALRLGTPLVWDPSAEHFTGSGSSAANAMLSREARSPWKLEV